MTLPRRLPLVLACLSLLTVAACQHDDDPPQTVFTTRGSTPVKVKTQTQTTQILEDPAVADATPSPERHSEPTSPVQQSAAPQKVDYPYAVPVQGKPGYVTSPYAPEAGYVDVKNMTPGQEARDPYTNKIFLVP